jgi:hypothetical protein
MMNGCVCRAPITRSKPRRQTRAPPQAVTGCVSALADTRPPSSARRRTCTHAKNRARAVPAREVRCRRRGTGGEEARQGRVFVSQQRNGDTHSRRTGHALGARGSDATPWRGRGSPRSKAHSTTAPRAATAHALDKQTAVHKQPTSCIRICTASTWRSGTGAKAASRSSSCSSSGRPLPYRASRSLSSRSSACLLSPPAPAPAGPVLPLATCRETRVSHLLDAYCGWSSRVE